jgi:hypothetical protein
MPDPFSASSLASSIITFLTLAYELGKRTREFSRLAGELPTDLQAAKDLVEIVLRTSERLTRSISALNNGPVTGTQPEYEADLITLFDKCTTISRSLLTIFDDLNSASSIAKALISIRKQRKIENIRNELEHCILSIEYVLWEASHVWTQNIRYVLCYERFLAHTLCQVIQSYYTL